MNPTDLSLMRRKLAEIEARREGAENTPWGMRITSRYFVLLDDIGNPLMEIRYRGERPQTQGNLMGFFKHAPSDIDALIGMVKTLMEERTK